MTRRNRIALVLALLAVAALVAWALRPRPVAVETAPVTRGMFEQTVADDGRTRVRERYLVSAPLAGLVERVRLEAGDAVKQGQTVAVLMPAAPPLIDARTMTELRQRVGAAEAQLARARAETQKAAAQREQARADFSRQKKLAGEGFVSETALEQTQLALQVAERGMQAARFAEEAARFELEQTRAALKRYSSGEPGVKWEIPSPVTGSVLKVAQKSEGPVALGAPLVEVADARSLEAVVDVLSQEAVAIRPGMPARVELGRGVAPLPALVRLIEPAAFTKVSALGVEEQRVNVILDFAGPLDQVWTIGDGFRVEAAIVIHRQDNALKVPVGALFREEERWMVFVAQGREARKREVKLERRNSLEAMVSGGVEPGERVVVYPSDALRDGSRIELAGER
ncbi:MAG TPA: HlyD family efflux transporter periplasmic adaptor subunit [Burkholderiales bacterium]|nr:HlyD family efflux transporter periplasmic adaptor subunit [Burkholderiales bacterium]